MIVVRVKRTYADLLPRFLLNRQRDIEQMRGALSGQDFSTIRATAHRLKGAGAGYGFDQISVWVAEIEALCEQRDVPAIALRLDRMQQYLMDAKIELV